MALFTGEVGRIRAYDEDTGVNAELTYTLDEQSGAYQYFRMDQNRTSNEGILTIVKVCLQIYQL